MGVIIVTSMVNCLPLPYFERIRINSRDHLENKFKRPFCFLWVYLCESTQITFEWTNNYEPWYVQVPNNEFTRFICLYWENKQNQTSVAFTTWQRKYSFFTHDVCSIQRIWMFTCVRIKARKHWMGNLQAGLNSVEWWKVGNTLSDFLCPVLETMFSRRLFKLCTLLIGHSTVTLIVRIL